MVRYKPKKANKAKAVKRRKKDLDEVYNDLQPAGLVKIKNRPPDLDLPGMGLYYCIPCARYFMSEEILNKHHNSKLHKKRVKKLTQEIPYGVNLEEVYGMKIDNGAPPTTTTEEKSLNSQINDYFS
jgi:hypothetical protein